MNTYVEDGVYDEENEIAYTPAIMAASSPISIWSSYKEVVVDFLSGHFGDVGLVVAAFVIILSQLAIAGIITVGLIEGYFRIVWPRLGKPTWNEFIERVDEFMSRL